MASDKIDLPPGYAFEPVDPHGCLDCCETNPGYFEIRNGTKRCQGCGGLVLDLQELVDKVKQLQADLDWSNIDE